MSSNKPVASLGGLLLARKGGAKPAMRGAMSGLAENEVDELGAVQADLGWNDMGEDSLPSAEVVPMPAMPQAAEPEVLRQQTRLVHSIADSNLKSLREAQEREAEVARRAAFTLRLDQERHLRLKLASTIEGASAQTLVTRALDEFLARMPDIEHLANQVRRKATSGKNKA